MNHVLIPKLHTSRIIMRRKYYFIISGLADRQISSAILFLPQRSLISAWNRQKKSGIGMTVIPKINNSFRSKRVESQCSAAYKPAITIIPAILNCPAKHTTYGRQFVLRKNAMPAEAHCILLCAFCFITGFHINPSSERQETLRWAPEPCRTDAFSSYLPFASQAAFSCVLYLRRSISQARPSALP